MGINPALFILGIPSQASAAGGGEEIEPAIFVEDYTGMELEFEVGVDVAAGQFIMKLWAGGGGGAFYNGGSADQVPKGGNSGFTTATFSVVNGDIIKVIVGRGGRFANGTGRVGGLGGYPDGGNGGASDTSVVAVGAGGGGSTRVYINDVLVAVAGAGGGGGANTGSEFGVPATNTAAGGGETGDDSSSGNHGGTQSAGGVNDNAAQQNGSSLQGGHGYNTGLGPTLNTTPAGGGGGGGLFGGSGGGNAAINSLGSALRGSGGSGYINVAHDAYISGTTTQGTQAAVAGANDDDYEAGIGEGGLANAGTTGNDNGGDGQAWLSFGN